MAPAKGMQARQIDNQEGKGMAIRQLRAGIKIPPRKKALIGTRSFFPPSLRLGHVLTSQLDARPGSPIAM
jgi:hypothetical protein